MEKHVYVVTHGSKFSGANPGMTDKGKAQLRDLSKLLPAQVSEVVVGTGKRHVEMPEQLGLAPTRYTSAVGGPDSGEASVPGRAVDVVRLPCGTLVPYHGFYTTLEDGAIGAQALVVSLPHNSVICAGRPSMIMFGMDEAVSKSAAVYRLVIQDGKIAKFVELAATGEVEIHAV